MLDFNIALARNRAPDTDSGVVRGKFAYLGPEQALGEAMDFRSDIFSLGSLLYEMLTGEKAFPQPGMKAALAVAAADFLPPDRKARQGVHARAPIERDDPAVALGLLTRYHRRRCRNDSEITSSSSPSPPAAWRASIARG